MADERDFTGKKPTTNAPVSGETRPGSGPGGGYQFNCSDIHSNCNWTARGRDENEMRHQIENHAREHHNIKEMTEEVWNKIRGRFRRLAA